MRRAFVTFALLLILSYTGCVGFDGWCGRYAYLEFKAGSPRHFVGEDDFPSFPMPPPVASATYVLPDGWLPVDPPARLGDVDLVLRKALDQFEYSERSYFAAPKGFALVTRFERMNPDGTSCPPPDRWLDDNPPLKSFSFREFLRSLLRASPGNYRIFVFVVTPHSFTQNGKISREEAEGWLHEGANKLPPKVADRKVFSGTACTLLVYHFHQHDKGHPWKQQLPSPLPGREHLEKSQLLSSFGDPSP